MRRPQLANRDLNTPHPDRLKESHPFFSEIMLEHSNSLLRQEPGYLDPESGFFVFNAKTLADEGKCCANECRHCPFKR